MEVRYFSNNASTTVVSDGGSTLQVSSTSNFPGSYPFYITVETTALLREVMKVTGLSATNTWYVTRSQESTYQRTFSNGDKVELRITAGAMNEIESLLSTSVQTTGTQSIGGNKTFSAAVFENKVDLSGTAVDLSTGSLFVKTISAATTFTVSNVPTTGTLASFMMDITNGGAYTITWWSNIKWAGGTAPTLTSSGRDILGFFSYDAGTTWVGLVLAKDVK